MANTYKNIVIVPNIGSNTADPRIVFSGANNTVDTDITLSVNPSTNGTLSIDGSRQLFSVTNSMVGIHFSVNDANGIPNIEITDSGIIRLAQYSGNVQILGGQASTSNTTGELQVTGGVGITGNVYADGVYDGGIELLTYFLGVDNTQNTNITSVNQFAAAAYTHANNAFNSGNTFASIEAGIDATQNTRLNAVETINTNQNTAISIIQGVDLGQNTTITAVNQFAQAAYNKANTGAAVVYSPNSVIFANSTGYLSNTANLTFSNTNILRVNGSITLANSLTTNTATIVFNSANNSIDFIF